MNCKRKQDPQESKENPVLRFNRRKRIDGSKEESEAIKMERDREYEKLFRMPPNCS